MSFLPFSLSLSLSPPHPPANSLEHRNPLCSLSCPGFQDPLERAPCAFMSDASPMSRALLVLCVNQGISASFSLSLSYCWLWTTRFWSIKGPQQVAPRTGTLVYVVFRTEWLRAYWGRDLLRSVSTKTQVKRLESPIISLLYFTICLKLRDFWLCANEERRAFEQWLNVILGSRIKAVLI